jgi:hypothetical protein
LLLRDAENALGYAGGDLVVCLAHSENWMSCLKSILTQTGKAPIIPIVCFDRDYGRALSI